MKGCIIRTILSIIVTFMLFPQMVVGDHLCFTDLGAVVCPSEEREFSDSTIDNNEPNFPCVRVFLKPDLSTQAGWSSRRALCTRRVPAQPEIRRLWPHVR